MCSGRLSQLSLTWSAEVFWQIERQDLLVQIFMDLARAGRMLGMTLILGVSYLLVSFLVVHISSSQDSMNYSYSRVFTEKNGFKVGAHNIITYKVLYS